MGIDFSSLMLAKKYTDLAQLGLVSITVEGTNIILTRDDGSKAIVNVPTPKDGISITDVKVKNNILTCIMSDGTTINAGEIKIDSSELKLDNYYTKTDSDELYINKNDIESITSDEIKAMFI